MKYFNAPFLSGILMFILVPNLFAQSPGVLWTKTHL